MASGDVSAEATLTPVPQVSSIAIRWGLLGIGLVAFCFARRQQLVATRDAVATERLLKSDGGTKGVRGPKVGEKRGRKGGTKGVRNLFSAFSRRLLKSDGSAAQR